MSNSAAELDHSIFGFIDALSGLSDSAAIIDALHRALGARRTRGGAALQFTQTETFTRAAPNLVRVNAYIAPQ